MNFDTYQEMAREMAIYPLDSEIIYPVLGLNGEAGEVAEAVKKVIRDDKSFKDPEVVEAIAKELGDTLFYLSAISDILGVPLNIVADMNLEKLKRRKIRNNLRGNL